MGRFSTGRFSTGRGGRVAATACLAGAALVGGCKSGTSPDHTAVAGNAAASSYVDLTGAIPWIAAPAEPPTPVPLPAPPPRPTDARPCAAADVTARLDEGNGAGGHLIRYVAFRNVSDSPCVLEGYPRVVVSDPGRPDVAGTDGSFFSTDGTADMAPGQETLLGIETDTYCDARPTGGGGVPPYHRAAITLPGGGTVGLDVPDGLDVTCGLHLTEFTVPLPDPGTDVHADGLVGASLTAPVEVAAGSTLRYVVELTNPSDQPVLLDPCPEYLQAAGPARVKDIETLNCGPVGSIGGRGSVRFEMRVPIPPDTARGPMRLDWYLLGPGLHTSVPAQAVVTVT